MSEQFNIKLSVDSKDAFATLEKIERRLGAVEKRATGLKVSAPEIFKGEAAEAERVIRAITNVRASIRQLKKEQKEATVPNEVWRSMTPAQKKSSKAEMRRIIAGIKDQERIGASLVASLKAVLEGPREALGLAFKRLNKLQEELRSVASASVGNLESELGKELALFRIKSQQLSQVKGDKAALLRSSVPRNAEQRRLSSGGSARANKEKYQELQAQENALQSEVDAVSSRISAIRGQIAKVIDTPQINELKKAIATAEANRDSAIKYIQLLGGFLGSVQLPRTMPPAFRGNSEDRKPRTVNYDPIAALSKSFSDPVNSDIIARQVAQALVKRIGGKSTGPSSGLLNEAIIEALERSGVISTVQKNSILSMRAASEQIAIGQAFSGGTTRQRKNAANAANIAVGYDEAAFGPYIKDSVEMYRQYSKSGFGGIGVRLEDIGEIIKSAYADLGLEMPENEDSENQSEIDAAIDAAAKLGDILRVLEENRDDDEAENASRNQYSADDKAQAEKLSNQRQNFGLGSDIETEASAALKLAQEKNNLVLSLIKAMTLGSSFDTKNSNSTYNMKAPRVGGWEMIANDDPEGKLTESSAGVSMLDMLSGFFPVQQLPGDENAKYGGITISGDQFLSAFESATQALRIIADQERLYGAPTPALSPRGSGLFYGLENEFSSVLSPIKLQEQLALENAQKAAWAGKKEASGSTALTFSGDTEQILPKMANGVLKSMIESVTLGAREPNILPGEGFGAVNSGLPDFIKLLNQMSPAVQELIFVAHDMAVMNGRISDKAETSRTDLSKLGIGNPQDLNMGTLMRMFDMNNYSPSTSVAFTDPNTGETKRTSTTGGTPGSYHGGPSIGLKNEAPIMKELRALNDQFILIYGGTLADLGDKMGEFDPETFRPKKGGVQMSYGQAFAENRNRYMEDIVRSGQRFLTSDITSALPQVEAAFEKLDEIGTELGRSRGELAMYKHTMDVARRPELRGFTEAQRQQALADPSKLSQIQQKYGGFNDMSLLVDTIKSMKSDYTVNEIVKQFSGRFNELTKLVQLDPTKVQLDKNAPNFDIGAIQDLVIERLKQALTKAGGFSAQEIDGAINIHIGALLKNLKPGERPAPMVGDVVQGPLRPYSTGERYEDRMSRWQRSQLGMSKPGAFASGELPQRVELIPGTDPNQLIEIKPLVNDVVAGLQEGVSAKESEISQAGRDMGKALGDGFDDQIGRHSPALYFIEAAEDSADGIIVGAKKKYSDLNEAGRKMAETFHKGYTDQQKVDAIVAIQNAQNSNNPSIADFKIDQMRKAPEQTKQSAEFVLASAEEVAKRNEGLAKRLKELADKQGDVLVALDIEHSGGLNAQPAKDGKPAKPGKRAMVYAYGASASYGIESEGRAAGNPNVPAVVPQSEGLGFGMLVPPIDPNSGTRFTEGAAMAVGLRDENGSNNEILPNLIKRMEALGIGEDKQKGDEQAYVDQLQDIAFLLNQLYQLQIPLTLHGTSLPDITTLGKEFAQYGIQAPTGKQFEDAGLLVETNNMAEMLKELFGKKIPQSITGLYQFFTGKIPGLELAPKSGVKPDYTEQTAVAHDPLIDAQASGVIAFSMRKMAEEVGAKQITITKSIVDFIQASWATVSDAIGGFRRFGPGKGDPKKNYKNTSDLKSFGPQMATHTGELQPPVPDLPRKAPRQWPTQVQPTLFDDTTVNNTMSDAEKLRKLEEELALLQEQREVEKERIKAERERLKQLYEVEKVIEAMSDNRAIGFDNITDSVIPGRVIDDKNKARLAKNNEVIATAKDNPELFAEVERQIASRWGKVPEYFTATLGTASRELADGIQKAIDRVNREINKILVENGQRTPSTRGPRGPRGNGGGNPPRGPRSPGDIGGGPDDPTPEYKKLMDGEITGNQHSSWLTQEAEKEAAARKRASDSTIADMKLQEKHVRDMEKTNRKMVDSWISTRYSLYDVASTYEDLGKKIRIATTYIREAVMVNAQYETAFTNVERVMQPLSDEVDGMRQRIIKMTQELPVAFEELARIQTLGGQMGINADGIENFSEQVVKYSAITGMSVDTVAEKFGRISQLADIPSDDFNKLASAVAYAGINAVATDQEIITLTESIAAATNIAGFGADETIGLATAISSLGIAPEQARGVIVRLFGDIERAMKTGGKDLTSYSKHLGLSAEQTKELWNTDPQGFFKRMLENLSKSKSMTTALDNLNIKETREVNTLQRLAKNMDVYNQSMSDAVESYANGTFVGDAYAKTQDNVAAKFAILQNNLKNFQDQIGEAFGPIFKKGLDVLNFLMGVINDALETDSGKFLVGIIAGVTTLTALFIGFQVATYKATAATLAMKTAMLQMNKLGGEKGGIKGFMDMLTGQERLMIASNGRIIQLSKDRLEAMKASGELKEFSSESYVGQALLAGRTASEAGNPTALKDIIAQNSGYKMDPNADPSGEKMLPVFKSETMSVNQAKVEIGLREELIQLRLKELALIEQAATKKALEADAGGDSATKEAQDLIAANAARETRRLESVSADFAEISKEIEGANGVEIITDAQKAKLDSAVGSAGDLTQNLDNAVVAADKGSAATSRFGKVLGVASKAAGWITLIASAITAATQVYDSFQIKLEESGGGLDSFREAIYKDTAAWKENGEAIGLAQSKVTESKVGLSSWAQSMEATTGSSAKMTTAITETTDSIETQTLALGKNSMEWLAQAAMNDTVIQGMFKRYFDAGKDLGEISKQANINLQDMIGMSLASPGKNGAEKYLRDYFDASSEVAQSSPGLYDDLKSIALQLDSTTDAGVSNSKMMKALSNGFKETDPDALNEKLKETAERVYTLTDYVGDLSSILSAAFTIRYGKEEATDQLAASWENVKQRIDDARQAIEKIKDEIKSMTADRNILEYQLNIALKYGDTMRADKLRAELDAKNKELADKDKELGKAQDGASTSLVGETQAAADNRAVMRGLVQEYNKYLEALANTATYEGLSDKQVAKKKKWLKEQADQAKADMLAKGASLGFSENEMAPYIKSFKDFRTIVDKLPKELTLRVDADPGTRAFMEWWAKGGKNASGAASSGTRAGGSVKPGEKPEKPMWTGPDSDPIGKPKKPDMLIGALKAMTDDWMTTVTGEWSGIFDNPIVNQYKKLGSEFTALYRGATEGWEGYFDEIQKNQELYPHFASLLRDQDAWNKANATEQRKILVDEIKFNAIPAKLDRMNAPTKEREKMAKEHASLYPGEYNPFNGKQNPGKPKNFGGEVLGNRASMSSIGNFRRNNMNANVGKNAAAVGAEKIFADYKAKVSLRNNYMAAGATEEDAISIIKKNAKLHAKHHPGEYNPYTRKQNPWPAYKADLEAKGLVPLRTRAELHAAMHPGEYNPFSGQQNTMPGNTGMTLAMKDKKTRLALGAEHERLFPGEFNPYLEKVNPMFEKDAKKDFVAKTESDFKKIKGGIKASRILMGGEKRDNALSEVFNAIPGTIKSKPSFSSITNIKELADAIANSFDNNYMGGKVGYASGGLIPGKSPSNPNVDNLVAAGPSGMIRVRSGEFIQSQPAVKYYGLDFMNAINNLQIPRYASGGMIGSVAGMGGSTVVELSPSAVMQIMSLANRPVNLYSDDRQIASSANRGNMLLAMRGSN